MLTGIELRRLRQDADLQQQEVAAAAGIDRWRLSQIEKGPIQGKPLSRQEERAIRIAVARLGELERKRKAIIARDTRARRRPDGEPSSPPSESAASGEASEDAAPEAAAEEVSVG